MPTTPRFATPSVEIEHRTDGSLRLRSCECHPAVTSVILKAGGMTWAIS